jgi:hypothetical protein
MVYDLWEMRLNPLCTGALYCYPLTPPFQKLVQQHVKISHDKPTYIKAEKFGRVPRAELQPNLRLVRMPQPRIFHLPGNLVCRTFILVSIDGL